MVPRFGQFCAFTLKSSRTCCSWDIYTLQLAIGHHFSCIVRQLLLFLCLPLTVETPTRYARSTCEHMVQSTKLERETCWCCTDEFTLQSGNFVKKSLTSQACLRQSKRNVYTQVDLGPRGCRSQIMDMPSISSLSSTSMCTAPCQCSREQQCADSSDMTPSVKGVLNKNAAACC